MQNPILSIKMKNGAVIKIELFHAISPNTVNSVIHLAKAGLYDGRKFYRVVKDFVLQTDCDKRKNDSRGCDYALDSECSSSGHMTEQPAFVPGIVGMAGMGGGSNVTGGSAFFIMTGEHTRLNGNFPVIGRVIDGMDEVMRINSVKCRQRMFNQIAFHTPEEPEIMETVTVETFGVDYPLPKTKPYPPEYMESEDELNEFLGK
jgi:peptidyl-prolyl cis-trans isomerase B (cyclophilin B)